MFRTQMCAKHALSIAALAMTLGSATQLAAKDPPNNANSLLQTEVGERVPSEDAVVADFHSMGLIAGHTNIFRSACPVRDLAKEPADKMTDDLKLAVAVTRMRHLRELGIRTIISFERPHDSEPDDSPPAANIAGNDTREKASVALERVAAEQAGIRFVLMPMYNSGPNSLEDATDERVMQQLEVNRTAVLAAAADGGVLFHCSAGHDRAGIVAAYIRMRDQHWPAEEAIAEMRRYGHNWPKFSRDGSQSSWHEDHLRAISKLLAAQAVAKDN